jgi:hypothetical protein
MLPVYIGSRLKDQRAKGKHCDKKNQDLRRNAVHTPDLQNVGFNIREVKRIGNSNASKVDREHPAP